MSSSALGASKSRWFRKGDRVQILVGIAALKHRKNRNGRIIRIEGSYIYVRPMWWPKRRYIEVYPNEIKKLKNVKRRKK